MKDIYLIVKEEGIKIYKDDPASAILCEDQERARLLIWLEDANGYNSYQYFKPKIGSIYPVPGIEFEPVQIDCKLDDCWLSDKCTHYLNPEKCHSKTVARLIEHTAENEYMEKIKDNYKKICEGVHGCTIVPEDQELPDYAKGFKDCLNVVEAWKESMNAAIKDAIEQQEQGEGNTEVHYSGYEEAIRYAIEMMDKHVIAESPEIDKEEKRILVFDCLAWSKTGDIGDNSQFFKPATVIRERSDRGEPLVDVRFDDGKISNGHFKRFTKPVNLKP